MKQKRLSTKIAAIVTISLTVVFGLLMATVVLLSGKTTSTNIRNELTNLAHANGNQVQAILDSASNQAISIQDYIIRANKTKASNGIISENSYQKSVMYHTEMSRSGIEMENYLLNNIWGAINGNENLLGIGAYFEPGKYDKMIEVYSLYATREDTANETAQIENEYSDYSQEDYYRPVKESGKPYISKPYVENGITMVTVSYPILHQGDFKGVVLADIDISRFNNITVHSEKFHTLNASILSNDLTIAYDSESINKVGTNLETYYKDSKEVKKITDGMSEGKPFTCNTVRADGRNISQFFYPINAQGVNWWAETSLDKSDMIKDSKVLIITIALISLLALIAIIAIVVFVIAKALKPIQGVVSAANKIVDGDLDVEVEARSDDEIGILSKAFLEMSGNLKIIIGDIGYLLGEMSNGNFAIQTGHKEKYIGEYQKISEAMTSIIQTLSDTLTEINTASQQVSVGADQVSSAAQALSQGAAEQASSVEELSASIAEVTNQIKQNAENAALARDKAEENGVELMASNAQMKDMMDAMQQISNKASEISNIIKIVDDIAFQTNILALNAAVEAARAGNAGKGFAVVADEVRNLAAKSAEAAKSTAVLIEQTIETVNNGFTIADKAALSLSKSAEVATSAAAVVDSIATASREQAEAIMQINQGIEQIAAVVQTNSATAEESAAASEELSGQAEMLKQLVSRFNLPDSAMKDLIKHHDFEAISTASKSTSLSLTGKY